MNLQSLFQDFNISKFVVYTSLLSFLILFSLRLDEFITIKYVYVFMPLWIWKTLVILGSFIGTIVFLKNPQYRHENDSYIQFKSMLISLSLHLILLMFEFLLCDRLSNNGKQNLWILVFIPLIVSSIISVFFCIWAIKQQNDRSFELELFLSVNALQFVFIPLKLDGFISWSWEIVFVPIWILLCLSLVMMLYSLIFCSILIRTPEMNLTQRQNAINSAISNILVLPILVFQILLADKLDNDNGLPYTLISIPLMVTLFALVLLSFCSKGSSYNKFWFGMRNNMFLNMLGEYGNISITYSRNQQDNGNQTLNPDSQQIEEKNHKKNVPIIPHFSIETPD
ncbi:transmembrane protein 185B [Chironomus tepperi]|uniref:transmembrane protein 185B n=1 Tax=Chironomus tepperi TaxID=113505 RepID=UPI00391F6F0A